MSKEPPIKHEELMLLSVLVMLAYIYVRAGDPTPKFS